MRHMLPWLSAVSLALLRQAWRSTGIDSPVRLDMLWTQKGHGLKRRSLALPDFSVAIHLH